MQYCFHLYHRVQPSSQFAQLVCAIPDQGPFHSLLFPFTALHLTCSTGFVGPPGTCNSYRKALFYTGSHTSKARWSYHLSLFPGSHYAPLFALKAIFTNHAWVTEVLLKIPTFWRSTIFLSGFSIASFVLYKKKSKVVQFVYIILFK